MRPRSPRVNIFGVTRSATPTGTPLTSLAYLRRVQLPGFDVWNPRSEDRSAWVRRVSHSIPTASGRVGTEDQVGELLLGREDKPHMG